MPRNACACALVDADMEAADRLHADDFEVVNSTGRALPRDRYLAAVASGGMDYHAWEADSISVRLWEPVAAIRYRSQVDWWSGENGCRGWRRGTPAYTRSAVGNGRSSGSR